MSIDSIDGIDALDALDALDTEAERRPLPGQCAAAPATSGRSVVTQLQYPGAVYDDARVLVSRYRVLALVSDSLSGLMAGAAGLFFRFGATPESSYVVFGLAVPLLWLTVVAAQRGYQSRFLGTGPEEYRRLADATLVLFALTAVGSFSLHGDLSRGFVFAALPGAFLLSLAGRRRLRSWLFRKRLSGHGLQKVLVVGPADAARHLIEQFDREPWHGLVAVGACVPVAETDGGSMKIHSIPIVGDLGTILEAVDNLEVQVVAVAAHPDLSGHALRRLAWSLDERGVDLVVSPGIIEVVGPRLSIRPVAGLSLLHLERPATRGGRMLIKVALDRLLGAVLFLIAVPAMAVAAVAVRFSSPGPVLFRQNRVGVGGQPFQMLKFRSMVADAEALRAELLAANEGDGVLFKMRKDPRITRVGAVLRRFSIDELPQLWNVVRGDMSLVGPRPPLPEEVAGYDDDAARRLRVRPGITGLWQVSGRSDLSWEESLRLDLRYVDNWSLVLDATILWRTWRAVLSRSGAY